MKKKCLFIFSVLSVFSVLLTACGGISSVSSAPVSSGEDPSVSDVSPGVSEADADTTDNGVVADSTAADQTAGEGNPSQGNSVSGATTSRNVSTTKGSGTAKASGTTKAGEGNKTSAQSSNAGGTSTTSGGTIVDGELIGGNGMLDVKDGALYQPKSGKYNDYIKYRDTLGNTYNKLTSGKKLKVVYFGGSVTVGYGASNQDKTSWRALIGQWLTDTFPNAEVTNLNRGTGESGTYLGSYRFERDVINANPDLVFIEYSINDYYATASYGQAASQYETIVRSIRQKLPECDIVCILVTDQGLANGRLHTQAQAHEDVSIAYSIPTVHVGRALATHLINSSGSDVWANYMIDGVHPNDKGYSFYYEVIREFVENCLVNCSHTGGIVKHTVPAQQCNVLHDGNVTVIEPTAAVISRSEALGGRGFSVMNNPYGVNNYDCYFYADAYGSEIVIEFTGTELVMLNRTNSIEEFKIKIDDGAYKTAALKGVNDLALNPTVLVTGLASGKHTVHLRVAGKGNISIAAFYSRDAAKASRK